MKSRPKILVFIDWFYPAFKAGGPIRSISNLISHLQSDFEISLVTSTQDIGREQLEVIQDQWTDHLGTKVIYLSKSKQTISVYRKILSEVGPEIVYYNSLFSFNFTLKPYFAFRDQKVKQVIAPRGMLGEGALKIKPLKKKLFLSLANRFLFKLKNTLWQATSQQEAFDIKTHIHKANISMASNFPPEIEASQDFGNKKKGEDLKLLFISRILPIKNLDFIIDCLISLNSDNVTLDIYGPIEDSIYWSKCEEKIQNLKTIRYCGTIRPDEVIGKLKDYDFYVLPSDSENFGQGIVEAICSGLPVLISQNTPWSDVNEFRAGFSLPLDLEVWLMQLRELIEMDQEEYYELSQNAINYAKKKFDLEALKEDYRVLFKV